MYEHMIKILCYGDSNTYGYIPGTAQRYDDNTRWTAVLARLLGDNYSIIEAGCNNRTCFSDNETGELQTGYKYINRYLNQKPDIIILSLGINDLQCVYNPSLIEFETGLKQFIEQVKMMYDLAKILVISPPCLDENVLRGDFSVQFNKDSVKKSKLLPGIYEKISSQAGCIYLNPDISPSSVDGLHFSKDAHLLIAKKIKEVILKL